MAPYCGNAKWHTCATSKAATAHLLICECGVSRYPCGSSGPICQLTLPSPLLFHNPRGFGNGELTLRATTLLDSVGAVVVAVAAVAVSIDGVVVVVVVVGLSLESRRPVKNESAILANATCGVRDVRHNPP